MKFYDHWENRSKKSGAGGGGTANGGGNERGVLHWEYNTKTISGIKNHRGPVQEHGGVVLADDGEAAREHRLQHGPPADPRRAVIRCHSHSRFEEDWRLGGRTHEDRGLTGPFERMAQNLKANTIGTAKPDLHVAAIPSAKKGGGGKRLLVVHKKKPRVSKFFLPWGQGDGVDSRVVVL